MISSEIHSVLGAAPTMTKKRPRLHDLAGYACIHMPHRDRFQVLLSVKGRDFCAVVDRDGGIRLESTRR